MSSRNGGRRRRGPKLSIDEAIAELEAVGQEPEEGPDDVAEEPAAEPGRAAVARRRAAAALRRARGELESRGPAARRRAVAAALAHAEDTNVDEFVDRRKKSRNQQLAERAERAATVRPPTDHTLETLGTGEAVSAMARAGMGGSGADDGVEPGGVDPGVGGVDASLATGVSVAMGAAGRGEPDWGDNPEHLDSAAEVRADLLEDGHDPMDVDTEKEALFGHALVHAYANDPDMGGRTAEQLEAEHDLVVDAMDDFGFDHDSPLDVHPLFGLMEDER